MMYWTILKVIGLTALIVVGGIIVYSLSSQEERKVEVEVAEEVAEKVGEVAIEGAIL